VNALAPVAPRLAKLVRLLSSDQDGEVIGAARMILRVLRQANLDIHALSSVIETSTEKRFSESDAVQIYQRGLANGRREAEARAPAAFYDADWMAIAESCAASNRLTPRERDFVSSMLEWIGDGSEPTEKQAAWLKSIHRRVRP